MTRDYQLALVCTNKGGHDPSELAVLIPVLPRADVEVFRSMGAEIPEPTGEYAAALARRWGVAGTSRQFEPRGEHLVEVTKFGNRKSPVQLQDLPNGEVFLRLECPQCPRGRDVHLVAASAAFRAGDQIAQGLRHGAVRVPVDIGTLPPIFS